MTGWETVCLWGRIARSFALCFSLLPLWRVSQGADQQGEGQWQRSHGAGGQQERPEHPHSGDAAGAGAGTQLRGAIRWDLSQNETGESAQCVKVQKRIREEEKNKCIFCF